MTAMRGEPDPDVLAELTAPRRLTKAAPVDPVLGLVNQAGREARAAHPTPAPLATPTPADPRPTPAPPAVQLRKQGGYYAHDADVQRAQAAWKHTELLPDGYPSWSAFQLAAIMRLTEELERKHHGGQPFPPLPPGRRVR